MAWVQLNIDASNEYAPQLAQALEELGALAVTFADAADQPILEPAPGTTPLWQNVIVTALFEENTPLTPIIDQLIAAFGQPTIANWKTEPLPDQDWERAWMKDFKPMAFGKKLWVCPHGQKPVIDDAASEDISIVYLDPGLAFGTGTHATTHLCLKWLDEHIVSGQNIVDFGCGSGILAIAALKLGASHAWTTDCDEQALIATRENAKKNQVESRISVLQPDKLQIEPVDVLVANILANPLISLAEQLAKYVQPQGKIALSGILSEQSEQVLSAYTPWFNMRLAQQKEDWVCLEGIKL